MSEARNGGNRRGPLTDEVASGGRASMADEHDIAPEEWRRIADYGGHYQISSFGRVRRILKSGGYRLRKTDMSLDGYLRVTLCWEGQRTVRPIHALVFRAFHQELPSGMTVNHIDAVKTNNRPQNLEAASRKQQGEHAKRMNRYLRGESHCRAKLTDAQVISIRRLYQSGILGTHRLAKQFGVSQPTIWSVVRGRSWSHLAP
jgi:hypothetical protein